MIIGVDIRPFYGNQLTGVGIYTWEILHHLLKLDQKNQYKLFFNSSKKHLPKVLDSFTAYDNVELFSFRYPSRLLNASLYFLGKPEIDRMVGGCDIFWFPNLNLVGKVVEYSTKR